MDTKIQLLQSNRGTNMLGVDGFIFNFKSKSERKLLWECQSRRGGKCRARVHTNTKLDEIEILKEIDSHNHDAPKVKGKSRRAIRRDAQLAKLASENLTKIDHLLDTITPETSREKNVANQTNEIDESKSESFLASHFTFDDAWLNLDIVKQEPELSVPESEEVNPTSMYTEDTKMSNECDLSDDVFKLCLICNQKECSLTATSRNSEVFNKPNKKREEILSPHLWSIFILRRVLHLSKQQCTQLLSQLGSLNPGDWFILCESCCTLAQNVFRLQCKISKLAKNLTNVKRTLATKLNQSVRDEDRTFERADKKDFRRVVQCYLRDNHCYTSMAKTDPVDYDNSLPDLSPSPASDNDDNCIDVNEIIPYEPLIMNWRSKTIQTEKKLIREKVMKTKSLSPLKKMQKKIAKARNLSSPLDLFSKVGTGFKCKLCPYTSSKFTTVRRHVYDHKHCKRKCILCNWPITSDIVMDRHIKKYHDANYVPPPREKPQLLRPKKLSTKSPLNLLSKAGTGFKCKMCPYTSTKLTTVRRHIYDHNSCKRKCNLCNWPINSDVVMDRHMKKYHAADYVPLERPLLKCDKCSFESKFNRELRFHKDRYHKRLEYVDVDQQQSTYSCKLCPTIFDNEDMILRHVGKKHMEALGMSAHLCHICAKSCRDDHTLKKHMRWKHTVGKPHKCDICAGSFHTPGTLKRHKLTHLSETERQALICDECGFSFLTASGLRRHKHKAHSFGIPKVVKLENDSTAELVIAPSKPCAGGGGRNKSTACKHCDKVCINGATLTLHCKEAHPELFKFKCETCGAKFICRKNLRKHVRRMHEKPPWPNAL